LMSNRTSESSMPALLPSLILLGFMALILALLLPRAPARTVPEATLLPPTQVASVPTEVPPTATSPTEVTTVYSAAAVAEGQSIYSSLCSACHGLDARGIPGLGKNLIDSEFVHGLTDDELLDFIIVGRDSSHPDNTTGMPMPPRGGNPSLTDAQLLAVIAYLRSEATASVAVAPTTAPVVQAVPTEAPLIRQTATPIPTRVFVTPQPFDPSAAYAWSCDGCHGADGQGNPPFGSGFHDSALLEDPAALLAFLTEGRPLADPRVEFPHPASGGYPTLTDEQLSQLIDYVYHLVESD